MDQLQVALSSSWSSLSPAALRACVTVRPCVAPADMHVHVPAAVCEVSAEPIPLDVGLRLAGSGVGRLGAVVVCATVRNIELRINGEYQTTLTRGRHTQPAGSKCGEDGGAASKTADGDDSASEPTADEAGGKATEKTGAGDKATEKTGAESDEDHTELTTGKATEKPGAEPDQSHAELTTGKTTDIGSGKTPDTASDGRATDSRLFVWRPSNPLQLPVEIALGLRGLINKSSLTLHSIVLYCPPAAAAQDPSDPLAPSTPSTVQVGAASLAAAAGMAPSVDIERVRQLLQGQKLSQGGQRLFEMTETMVASQAAHGSASMAKLMPMLMMSMAGAGAGAGATAAASRMPGNAAMPRPQGVQEEGGSGRSVAASGATAAEATTSQQTIRPSTEANLAGPALSDNKSVPPPSTSVASLLAGNSSLMAMVQMVQTQLDSKLAALEARLNEKFERLESLLAQRNTRDQQAAAADNGGRGSEGPDKSG